MAADLADSINTISNEILSQLGSRLGRVSIKESQGKEVANHTYRDSHKKCEE